MKFIIDYAYLINNNLYHGTISNLDGVVKATWSYEVSNQKITRDQPITDEVFTSLWNSIADLDVFSRYFVSDADKLIDPINYHVISIIFNTEEQSGLRTMLIPRNESDPAFFAVA